MTPPFDTTAQDTDVPGTHADPGIARLVRALDHACVTPAPQSAAHIDATIMQALQLAYASWKPLALVALLSFGGGVAAARALPRPRPLTAPPLTVPVGQRPLAIAVDEQTSRAFVVNGDALAGSVSVLDTRTGGLLRTVRVGSAPFAIAVARSTGRVFVVNSHMQMFGPGSSVSVLDARTGALVRTIPVGIQPYAVAVDDQARRVYILNINDGGVSVLDARTGRVLGTIACSNGGPFLDAHTLAVDARTKRAFVMLGGAGGYGIGVLDTEHRTMRRTVTLSALSSFPGPGPVAVDEATGRVFVASDHKVSLLDARSGTILHATDGLGGGLVVDARGGRAFTSSKTGIAVLDAHTGVQLHRVSLGRYYATPAAVDEQTGQVIVLTGGPADQNGIALGDGTATIVDGATGAIVHTASVGRSPTVAAIDGRTRHAFVVNTLSNTVSVLDLTQ